MPPANVVGRVRRSRRSSRACPTVARRWSETGDTARRRWRGSSRIPLASRATVVSVSAERQTYAEFVTALAGELGRVDNALRQEVERWKVTFVTGPIRFERTHAEAALDDLLQRAVSRAERGPLVLFIDEVTVLARNLEREKPGGGDAFLHCCAASGRTTPVGWPPFSRDRLAFIMFRKTH